MTGVHDWLASLTWSTSAWVDTTLGVVALAAAAALIVIHETRSTR